MLTYSMDARGNTPLYEYLYRCIRDLSLIHISEPTRP